MVQGLLQVPSMAEVTDYHETHRNGAILTGFEDFDRLTGGLQRADLIIVAAPPATGKTHEMRNEIDVGQALGSWNQNGEIECILL